MLRARSALVAAIGALLIVGSGLGHSPQPQQQADRSTKGEQNAKPHQERSDDIVPTVKLAPPDHLQKATHQDGYESTDERSEFWVILGHRTKITDFWLAVFTGLLVFVGIGQVYWLWRTVSDGNKQHAVVNRAFIYLDGFNPELTTLADTNFNVPLPEELTAIDRNLNVTRFAVQPRWKNSGNTPTIGMRIRVDWDLILQGSRQVGEYRFAESRFFVGPKSVSNSEFIETSGELNALIQAGQAGIHGPVPLMLIWGRADSEDIFRKSLCPMVLSSEARPSRRH
jgi:hypothetical protein